MRQGFISNYLHMVENTKPDYVYQVWSMLSTLSVFAGRRVWFPFGPRRYYPILYVALVGDPATGKSTAMERSLDVVRGAGICPVSGTRITKEALIKRMASEKFSGRKLYMEGTRQVEYNQYAIFATEFVDFLGLDAQGFLDFFTAAWDQPILDTETLHQGQSVVVGPYITLLACMTPEKLKGFMKLSVLTGGFARRCAWIYSSQRNRIDWPSFTESQQAAKDWCIEYGKRQQNIAGAFAITEDCKRLYETWNKENHETLLDKPPACRGWYESKGEILFKVSMLVALGEEQGLLIDVPHYNAALKFCDFLEGKNGERLNRVFEGAGINPNAGVSVQICNMLVALNRPMNKKQLRGMFGDQASSWRDLDDTLTHLVSVGKLSERTLQSNGSVLGTVIGTPTAMMGLSDSECVPFLGRSAMQQLSSGNDSSQEVGPPETLEGPHEDRNVAETPNFSQTHRLLDDEVVQ